MTAPSIPAAPMLKEGSDKALEPWFRVHPGRFIADRDGLEAYDFVLDESKLEGEALVVYTGSLPEYPDRKLIITFPEGYPSIPPQVVDDGKCERLPRHQRPSNRAYCLFGRNSEAWSARNFAVDVLSETKRVIDDTLGKLAATEAVEDPAPEPFSAQAIFGNHGTVLIPPAISEMLPEDLTIPAVGTFQIRKPKSNSRGIVTRAEFTNPQQKFSADEGYQELVKAPGANGRLVFFPNLESPILDGDDLIVTLEKFGLPTHGGFGWSAVIFPEQYGDSKKFRYTWLVFRYESNRYVPVITITYRPSEHSARIPGLEFLGAKRVGIIGCGSIGSKIAASLNAAGIEGLVLVDKETMEPANSVRHECGVKYFGISKAFALCELLSSLRPEIRNNCLPFFADPFNFGNTQRAKIISEFRKCDLIIEATGNQLLSRAVCELATAISRPVVFVSVTNGAWSGEIFRYLPGKTPCWLCHQSVIDTPPPGCPSPNGVYGPGCDQPTFTGSGHELDIVAGLATSFIVDTLRKAEEVESEYEGDYLLWEGRDSEGKLLQKTSVHRVNPRVPCWQCHNEA